MKVDNCVYYSAPKVCTLCVEDSYLKSADLCEKVSSPIANCEVHDSKQKCKQCKDDFVLDIDRTECVADPGESNCGMYSFVGCQDCKPGYIRNPNFYFELLFSFKNAESKRQLGNLLNSSVSGGARNENQRVCQKILVENCLEYESFDTCKICSSGFFAEEGKCVLNPLDSINKCEKYSRLDHCLECSNGHYLKTSKVCAPVVNIDYCEEYDGRSSKVSCRRCFKEFYLAGENNCQRRGEQSQIEFCKELIFNQEKCLECIEGFSLTSDLKKCLPSIDNCRRYMPSTRKDSLLECQECEEGFYWDIGNQICLEGAIAHCEIYFKNENKCALCRKGFFSKLHTCVQHQLIPNCDEYSGGGNLCQKCEVGHFLFVQQNRCVHVHEIEHCESYRSRMTCGSCEEGFYLKRNVCLPIPEELNCVRFDPQSGCHRCVAGFYKAEGRCVLAPQMLVDNCEEHNIDGEEDKLRCESCKENSVPVLFDNSVCQNLEILHLQNPLLQVLIDEECVGFAHEGPDLVCTRCRKGKVLFQNRCVETCWHNDFMTIYRHKVRVMNLEGGVHLDTAEFEQVNVCDKTIPNCRVGVQSVRDGQVVSQCTECVLGFRNFIKLGEKAVPFSPHPKHNFLEPTSPVARFPEVECRAIEGPQLLLGDESPQKTVRQCEYYSFLNQFEVEVACQKCVHGQAGTLVNTIYQCAKWNTEGCLECHQGFYLSNPFECLRVKTIPHCVSYDPSFHETTCTECKPNFYSAGIACVPRDVSKNLDNCTIQLTGDLCDCDPGYQWQVDHCVILPLNCLTLNGDGLNCDSCNPAVSFPIVDGNTITICKSGSISFCIFYEQGSINTCATCDNDHYLQNNACFEHNDLDD